MSTTQNEETENTEPKRPCFLTESQREALRGEKSDNYYYHVKNTLLAPRVESGALVEDLRTIRNHAPELWAEVEEDLKQLEVDEE